MNAIINETDTHLVLFLSITRAPNTITFALPCSFNCRFWCAHQACVYFYCQKLIFGWLKNLKVLKTKLGVMKKKIITNKKEILKKKFVGFSIFVWHLLNTYMFPWHLMNQLFNIAYWCNNFFGCFYTRFS